tara:strand:- start:8060 stop:8281 length:222 start_codon:yes stop_codon:yes gene_type:complete
MTSNKQEKIIKLLKKELDINRNINIEKTFEENNIDSLDKFTIISYIEKKNKIKISDKLFSKIKTPKDLFKYFK